jgi:uncharacterized membrane protein
MRLIYSSIAACSLLAGLSAAQPQPRYTVIDLGALGGAYSVPFGINGAGEVAGAAATSAQTDGFASTAFLWTKKGMTNLIRNTALFADCPTCNSAAAAVASSGAIAIGSEIARLDPNGEDFGQWEGPFLPATHRVTLGFILKNGVMTQLKNLKGGNNANVFWMNNLGEVSGVAETDVSDPSCSSVTPFQVRRFKGVVWGPNGDIERTLEPLQPDWVSYALTINDRGQVVGASGPCATTGMPPYALNNTTAAHAVLWDPDGSITDLGTLGGAMNIANNVNNRGEVLGTSPSPEDGTVHVFKWTRETGIRDYGAFPGAAATVAGCCHVLNDRGEIVGFSMEPENPPNFGRALIWKGAEPKDLNDFVRAPSPFVQLLAASSISDAGEIIGWGVTTDGEIHGFLATPHSGDAPAGNTAPSPQGTSHPPVAKSVPSLPGGRIAVRRR